MVDCRRFSCEGLGEVNVASPDLESSTVGNGSRKRGEALPTAEMKSKILPWRVTDVSSHTWCCSLFPISVSNSRRM